MKSVIYILLEIYDNVIDFDERAIPQRGLLALVRTTGGSHYPTGN